MRKVLVVFSALLILVLATSIASAQTPVPNVQVYFTSTWGTYGNAQLDECPVGTVGTLYVVANNFDMWMNAIEFYLELPALAGMTVLAESYPGGGIAIGSPSYAAPGVAIAWPLPVNAFVSVAVAEIQVFYGGTCCDEGVNHAIIVHPHQETGLVRAIRWPDLAEFNGVGMTSLICPTIPVEETTWGTIKALYDN